MESFSYQDLGRIVYAKALDIQTEKFNALLAAKAKGEKGRNELLFCEHDPVLTIGKSGKDSNLLIPANTDSTAIVLFATLGLVRHGRRTTAGTSIGNRKHGP